MAQSRLEKSVAGIKDPAKRKAEFYKRQREDAEETGDQKTTDKIYGKLKKKSHSVDTNQVDRAILGTVATGSALRGATTLARVGARAFPRAASTAEELVGAVKSKFPKLSGGKKKPLSGNQPSLPNSRSNQRALPKGDFSDWEEELSRQSSKSPKPRARPVKRVVRAATNPTSSRQRNVPNNRSEPKPKPKAKPKKKV